MGVDICSNIERYFIFISLTTSRNGLSGIMRNPLALGCRISVLFFAFVVAIPLLATERPTEFIAVASDDDYRHADDMLWGILQEKTGKEFERNYQNDYSAAISTILDRSENHEPFVARLTPYVLVASEMLGARFDLLATYNSRSTGDTTYSSYFIVRRSDFPGFTSQSSPQLAHLLRYLRELHPGSPPRSFVYHDKFSTSSYFLPSLYFRSQRIFAMRPLGRMTPIDVRASPNKRSSDLVTEVAEGMADVAAVWDGTLHGLDPQVKDNIFSIQLPTRLPNDLLVSSQELDLNIKNDIETALDAQPAIGIGDFDSWIDIRKANTAREALAQLRRLAAAPPAPTAVDIRWASGQSGQSVGKYLEAARQAVRLSGTEFVLYDKDYHKCADLIWTLQLIHDGSIYLTCDYMKARGIEPQNFTISFTDAREDLTARIGELIRSRMHRIRYIWPYQQKYPAVIRDVDFTFSPGDKLKIVKISWVDPDQNDFQLADTFDATVRKADFYRFELKNEGFPTQSDGVTLDFDPMSNISYRVYLIRPAKERFLFLTLTISFEGRNSTVVHLTLPLYLQRRSK
jgi:ABC-type phosphate/phosphonate transport system substrate-binding protein